jgi:hypothetical protein
MSVFAHQIVHKQAPPRATSNSAAHFLLPIYGLVVIKACKFRVSNARTTVRSDEVEEVNS